MDPRLTPLAAILDLNTHLFGNCLDGLSDEQAVTRVVEGTNHVAFLAAHMADSRFFALKVLGQTVENPLAPVLAGAKTLEDVKGPLPLDATRAAWATVSAALRAALESLTPEQLDAPSTMRFPISDKTLLGVIAFLVQHDAYHLGQLSLLRRQLGLAGMSYK